MSSGVNSSLVLRAAGKGWKDSQQSLRKWISPETIGLELSTSRLEPSGMMGMLMDELGGPS